MSQSQSNAPNAPAQPDNQIQSSNNPMDVRARLDALPTKSSKQKDLDLVKTWLDDLNQVFPGHTTDTAPQSQPATSSRAITMVDHTARTLSVIGETVPGAAPLKGVGSALERIAELAKTARGNREEATRLGKHADSIKQLLTDKLGSAEIDKEVEQDLRAFEVSLNVILIDLERFQRLKGKQLQGLLFSKDHKDELRGLQQRLDDAFKTFLTASTMALRFGMARLEARTSSICQTPDVSKKGEEKTMIEGSDWITALSIVFRQFIGKDRLDSQASLYGDACPPSLLEIVESESRKGTRLGYIGKVCENELGEIELSLVSGWLVKVRKSTHDVHLGNSHTRKLTHAITSKVILDHGLASSPSEIGV
ncbi:hypothetical protein VNI00_011324 [Paramarasmius palmivorus]|uniref:Uncharacterized protein n=1 Tax=Paramarasmius palmivorus TaxID=297713 RepID=A0AAW0CD22_9AGAR